MLFTLFGAKWIGLVLRKQPQNERHLYRAKQSGSALIIVLWTTLLISMALAIALVSTRIEARIIAARWEHFSAREAALSGLDYAAYKIATQERRQLEHLEHLTFFINGYDVSFSQSIESEKLDVNLADEQTMARFFYTLHGDQRNADMLAARIADWRDEDDLPRPNGAEASDYINNRNGKRIGNRPFYSVDELNLVLGTDIKLTRCVIPALTIFGDGTPPSSQLMEKLYDISIKRIASPAAQLGTASQNAVAGHRYAITANVQKRVPRRPHTTSLTGIFRITGKQHEPYEWMAQFTPIVTQSNHRQCSGHENQSLLKATTPETISPGVD